MYSALKGDSKEETGESVIVTVGLVESFSGIVIVNVLDDAEPTCVVAVLFE
jgi:hypothetical protein